MNIKSDIKKMLDKILEKRFSINMSAGYESLEVDIFFDEVRRFLMHVMYHQDILLNQLKNKDSKIKELENTILSKNSFINQLNKEIESYKKDGYQNYTVANEIGKIYTEIEKLKKSNNK